MRRALYALLPLALAGTALAGLISIAGGRGPTSTGGASFAERCAAPGVLMCEGFDDTVSSIVQGVTLFEAGDGQYHAGLDTSIKASGAGSLRFDLEPPPRTTGPNIGGQWRDDIGQTFSENSTFYVQHRLRLSDYMVEAGNFNNTIWKVWIIHAAPVTCAGIELTLSDYYSIPLAQLDTACGGIWMWTHLDGSSCDGLCNPPMLMQQPVALDCRYGDNFATDCINYIANDWMTVYCRVQVGTWDDPNSEIDCYLGYEGEALRQFIQVREFVLSCNGADETACNNSPAKDQGFNRVTLTPYITSLSNNDGPMATAHMWFDELIVSTNPIDPPE